MIHAKPFLKWAGGKNQLLGQFENYYPTELKKGTLHNYVEPFVGGGAVFFALAQKYKLQKAFLSDINKDLVLTYQVIQRLPNVLLDYLQTYQIQYDQTPQSERGNLFTQVRNDFNLHLNSTDYQKIDNISAARAAQFIFLNKTCFNGLYRTNAKGIFNVPYGKYKTALICDAPNISAVSKLLQNAHITYADYALTYEKIDANTFVYLDPPYRPISASSNFNAYNGKVFDDQAQLALAAFYKRLDEEKQAKLMLSNSDPQNENPTDTFFERAYKGYQLLKVSASRSINSDATKRGKINGLLTINYPYEPQSLGFNF
jgi:DNA adenine methylase